MHSKKTLSERQSLRKSMKNESKNDSVEIPFSTKFYEMTPLALKAPQIHPRVTKDIQNWEKGCPRRSLLGALVFIFRHLTCAGVRFVVVSIPRRDRHSAPVYHLCRKGNALGSRALLQRHSWQFCSSATQPPNMFSEFWLRRCSRHEKNLNGTVAKCARSAFVYIYIYIYIYFFFLSGKPNPHHQTSLSSASHTKAKSCLSQPFDVT